MQVLANTYITRIKNYVKFLQKKEEKKKLRWISQFSNSSWIKATASGLSYELGVNGGKRSMETGILLIKMDIAHFTLVNLEILTT